MTKKEDPELTSSYIYTEAISIATNSEHNLKTGREDLPQPVIERKTLTELEG